MSIADLSVGSESQSSFEPDLSVGSACLGFDPVCSWRTYCREEAEEDDEELRVDYARQQRRLVTDVGRALDALAAVQPHVPVHG